MCLLFFTVGLGLRSFPVSAQAPAAAQQLCDGQHDVDFHFGTWHTHIRLLGHPLTGSNTWVESNGTVTVRKIWNGRANLEELEAGNSTTPFKGMTLLLYNPQARQRSQAFANFNDGTLKTPLMGDFKNGRGEFYGQENITAEPSSFASSGSTSLSTPTTSSNPTPDGGKTWEPNFVANLTREKE
jgi:hypothetical protein